MLDAEEGSSSDDDSCAGHVMISYQWDVQPIMLKVRDRLQAEGYDVWMDVDNMSKCRKISVTGNNAS